jgi:hypothetical protein
MGYQTTKGLARHTRPSRNTFRPYLLYLEFREEGLPMKSLVKEMIISPHHLNCVAGLVMARNAFQSRKQWL